MSSKLRYLMAGAFALSLAAPLVTYAAPVTLLFDPTGAGGPGVTVATIDQTVGSALAVGGNTAVQNFLAGSGTKDFTLYYQANLGTMLNDTGGIVYTNGTAAATNPYFTFVAGFGETVAGSSAYPGTSSFVLNPGSGVNYFHMYATDAQGNNLTGGGFATGNLILSGTITDVNSSNFQITGTTPQNLDQAGIDNWNEQKTVTGAGSSDFEIKIKFADPVYFLNTSALIDKEILWSFFNNSQIDPFKQVDPSQCFDIPGNPCSGGGGGIPSFGTLGAINGNLNSLAGTVGDNFMFQADGNQSFVTRVPEPATIALIGLGLSLIGFFNRRRYTA